MNFCISLLFLILHSRLLTFISCEQVFEVEKPVPRHPKIFSIFQYIFSKFPSPSTSSSRPLYKQKFGEVESINYNQYFTKADPYNQNQLLNAVGVGPSRPIFSSSSSEGVVSGTAVSHESPIDSVNSLFSQLIGDDTSSTASILSNIVNLGTGSMESVFKRINNFDGLKCIPRLLCQTIAQRQLDATTSVTPITTPLKPKHLYRQEKTIKFQGVETALEQFMAFLDLVQLKNWSLYPYLKGAYEGSQVKRLDECAQRFQSCPFSDQQLVYYFNNYNGGFFQALRSD